MKERVNEIDCVRKRVGLKIYRYDWVVERVTLSTYIIKREREKEFVRAS